MTQAQFGRRDRSQRGFWTTMSDRPDAGPWFALNPAEKAERQRRRIERSKMTAMSRRRQWQRWIISLVAQIADPENAWKADDLRERRLLHLKSWRASLSPIARDVRIEFPDSLNAYNSEAA